MPRVFLGVIHLLPLPGSPRWAGSMDAVLDRAAADARAYAEGGADAVVIENFGDVPFTAGAVPPETVAAMAVAAAAVRAVVPLPFGFNVLRNDARAALGLCAAAGGRFLRVNVHAGAMLTDQGVIEGRAFETLRVRQALCPAVKILADVQVKHAVPLAPQDPGQAARDTLERGLADALIVTGPGTGLPADEAVLRRVRAACPDAVLLVGSGVTADNAAALLAVADGVIVGSSLKRGGDVRGPVDPDKVRRLAEVVTAVGRESGRAERAIQFDLPPRPQ